jgi:hypothetical protein
MHWMSSFHVPPPSTLILHEINSLPDVPGVGIDALLPCKPFYSRCYVLSITIRGDIRALPTAPVTHLFDEFRWQSRVKITVCAPSRSTSDGRVVHLGLKAKSHAREMHAVVVRRDAPHALDPLASLGACSHSREIGFRKADARDRQQRVGLCLSSLP